MKKTILMLMLLAAPSITFAEEGLNLNLHPKAGSETAKEHLDYTKEMYKNMYPELNHKDYEIGALMFDPAAKAYSEEWQKRIDDVEFERPDEVAKFYAKGKKIYETPLPSGKTLSQCLPNGGKMIAGNYPIFDKKQNKVVTLEMLVNECVVLNGGAGYAPDDKKEFWPLMGYVRSLSNGMKVDVKVKGKEAQEAFNRGRDYYYTRNGKLNFACASCHVASAGRMLRGETLSPLVGKAPHFPAFRPDKQGGLVPWTLHRRYERCQEQVGVDEKEKAVQGSKALNDLEYFHTYMSNGLDYVMGVFRK